MEDARNGAPGVLSVPALVLALEESDRELEHVKEIEASALVLLLTMNCVEEPIVEYKNLWGMAVCPLCWLVDGLETGLLMLLLSMEEESLAQLHHCQFG